MSAYAPVRLGTCPNCEKPNSARLGNSSRGHLYLVCSDKCGLEWAKKLAAWRRRKWRPGEKSPINGTYEVVGPRGGRTGWFRHVWLEERFPPTPKPGQFYKQTEDLR